ncbi:glycoside hydrolase family 16 protein [Bipolaris oryzae ATCC 44560]|uniref:Glycoside hydrolase family 16 protein n=1 Tax=Bipolaris oryzae ATCC 44560 TaxID=930090 RepID=W6YUG8_COCMI|nr:glycoside hydrolase family 16 protein [Bipolaris oryzae ATCC 44560]EUC41163.1 glycoside hydrolase family 16 protein [Bipolaris oryzae ATCC 44560]
MFSSALLGLALVQVLPVFAEVSRGAENCTCGFYDSQTKELYTDSIIVYFNETSGLPLDFVAEEFEQNYAKDWNAVFREGASPDNVRLDNGKSLQLVVQPATKEHLVQGASLRTKRRDIQHGSFRTLMRPAYLDISGTATTMMWKYNETEVTELSVMNNDRLTQPWVGTFVNNEFTTRNLGMNFSELINGTAANRNYTTLGGGLSNGSINPWDFTEYRIDWTADYINFYIGGNLTRTVEHKKNKGMPSVPSALFFKHWSTGNRFSMRGPPRNGESVADIGWIRMFFNSSTMNEDSREDFVARCPLTDACAMDDFELRGSTPYAEEALDHWKQDGKKDIKRMPALWISVSCLAISTLLLIHTFIRRLAPKVSGGNSKPAPAAPAASEVESPKPETGAGAFTESTFTMESTEMFSRPVSGHDPSSPKWRSMDDMTIERLDAKPGCSTLGGSTPRIDLSRVNSIMSDSRTTTPYASNFNTSRDDVSNLAPPIPGMTSLKHHDSMLTLTDPRATLSPRPDKVQMETVTESALPAPRMRPQPPLKRNRIDHLAGLTALCSLVVTIMHFGLTFVPAMVQPGADAHNPSEPWAQRIIGPFLLNQMWLGVFFTTSVRFLTAPYLRKGKMEEIAKAAVRRTPRLMIPVASVALLEYFFVDVGATKFLQYIPSLTWSTWPYVTRYQNFGQYISEVLELIYLVPNAVPQITLHYCTGVLWTIAVQLQGSWLVLLGAVVVYEIKTPWKRMCYYAFCLVNHWYAQSWGTYLWLGLLLTDLDVTYKWKAYLATRTAAYYATLTFFWGCVIAGFMVNVVPIWVETTFNFSTAERGVHPDPTTGEAILNTERNGYPAYNTPRLNGLLFAGGMQAVVELSAVVQWILSTPPFLILFPHVFTIYLIHGLVFWSYGSWLMVFLADRGFSYGINVVVVGVTSYGVLFACLPIVTPVIEALGKDMTAMVWMTATNKSPPRRRTLFPYPDDLFTSRVPNEKEEENKANSSDVETGLAQRQSDESTMYHARSTFSEKGKGKAPASVGVHEMQAFALNEEQQSDRRSSSPMVSRFSG